MELFSPLGDPGIEALRELCRTVPDPDVASTALDALFDADPSSAAEIAEKRLVESLSHDCVPAAVVKLLHGRRLDPFAPIARRLDALGCERRRLRPEPALFDRHEAEEAGVREAAKTAAERISGRCREAFLELFGVPTAAAADQPLEHRLTIDR